MNFSKYFLLGVPSWDKKYHLTNFCPQEQEPVIEGQLKEKKGGRWSIFKKWKSRYFTLSGDKLTYKDTVMIFYQNEEIKKRKYFVKMYFLLIYFSPILRLELSLLRLWMWDQFDLSKWPRKVAEIFQKPLKYLQKTEHLF